MSSEVASTEADVQRVCALRLALNMKACLEEAKADDTDSLTNLACAEKAFAESLTFTGMSDDLTRQLVGLREEFLVPAAQVVAEKCESFAQKVVRTAEEKVRQSLARLEPLQGGKLSGGSWKEDLRGVATMSAIQTVAKPTIGQASCIKGLKAALAESNQEQRSRP